MSLLMDALKKAEAAKQRTVQFISAAAPARSSADPATSAGWHERTMPPGKSLSAAELATGIRRQVARNVFDAKRPPLRTLRHWQVAAVGFAILGIAATFGWQLYTTSSQPLPPQILLPPPHRSALPNAMDDGLGASGGPPTPLSLPGAPAETLPALSAGEPTSARTAVAKNARRPLRPESTNSPAVRAEARADPRPPPAGRIAAPVIAVSTASFSALQRAYDALLGNRPDEARSEYAAVLRTDPRNVDALLGLATLSLRAGQHDEAAAQYRNILDIAPDDPTAVAALANLQDTPTTATAEARLKTALAGQPTAAALHFSLGNHYARQRRWSEAQQAYFNAHVNDRNNPDYLFNLAVSLDHLRQPRLAAQYYHMAIAAAQSTRHRSFDVTHAQARLWELQP